MRKRIQYSYNGKHCVEAKMTLHAWGALAQVHHSKSFVAASRNMRQFSLSGWISDTAIGTLMSSKTYHMARCWDSALRARVNARHSGVGSDPAAGQRGADAWTDSSAESPVDGLTLAKLKRLSAVQLWRCLVLFGLGRAVCSLSLRRSVSTSYVSRPSEAPDRCGPRYMCQVTDSNY